MKKLTILHWVFMLLTVGVLSTVIFNCTGSDKKPGTTLVTPPPIVTDTTIHVRDSVLENPNMDAYSEELNARRKPPKPKPHPNDPIPPVVTPVNGCFLLDFNGHTVANTMWNVAGNIVCNASGLTTTGEQDVFNRVVAYYALFAPYILVTRDETVFNSYPQNKRRRIIITTSWEWFGQSGGVAYLNSFSWFDDSPAFVFSSLLQYNTKNISDAVAHEGSHTLGNRHQSEWKDGVKINEYLWGDLIMGASYGAQFPRWGIGLNSLGVIQNDTAVIFETLRK